MRNKRRVTALVVIATAAAVVAGGLMASNMGFKLNSPLAASAFGVSNSGRTAMALPYNRQVGIDVASELLADVNAGGINAIQLEKFVEASDTNQPYPGAPGAEDFALEAGRAYLLRVIGGGGDYIVVGSHDPGFSVSLLAAASGVSNSGRTRYAHPYHGVASVASELLAEIGPSAIQVEKFVVASDTNQPYPGAPGAEDFALVPGTGYLVRVLSDVNFTPAHY